jgi:hypothetical protein
VFERRFSDKGLHPQSWRSKRRLEASPSEVKESAERTGKIRHTLSRDILAAATGKEFTTHWGSAKKTRFPDLDSSTLFERVTGAKQLLKGASDKAF